jgi:hypothetical protein
VQYNADGSRTYLIAQNPTTHSPTTTLAIINSATGEAVATPVSVAGGFDSLVFSPDGHAVLVTDTPGVGTAASTTVTFVDATTGADPQKVTTTGQFDTLEFSTTANSALLTTTTVNSGGAITSTHVSVIDTATGDQLATITLSGQPVHPTTVITNPAGSDVGVVFTQLGTGTKARTTVTTVDLATGAKIDSQTLNAPLSAVQYDPATKTTYVIAPTAADTSAAASVSIAVVSSDGQIKPLTLPGTFVSLTPNTDHLHTAIITNTSTGQTTLTTLDTTGTRIADVTITGTYQTVQYNLDGSRTYLIAQNPTTHSPTTTLAIINS